MRMTIRVLSLCLLFAAVAICGAATSAAAQGELTPEQKVEAKEHFVAGSQHFEAEEYEEAIVRFRKAFELVRLPEIIYNIARCHEELKHTEEAITHYEMYLHFYPDASDAEEVKVRIKILRAVENSQDEDYEDDEEGYEDETEDMEAKVYLTPWGMGLEIGGMATLASGADGKKSPSMPIGINVSYVVLEDWLAVTGGIAYGYYFNDQGMEDPRNNWILEAGARGVWAFSEKMSFVARLCVSHGWIMFRKHSANLFSGRATAGLGYLASERWRLLIEGAGRIGLEFGKDTYDRKLSDGRLEVGAVGGAEYLF